MKLIQNRKYQVPDKTKENTKDYKTESLFDGFPIKFAKCCNPIYDDDVIGLVSMRKYLSIHTLNCGHIKHHERIIRIDKDEFWKGQNDLQVLTAIVILRILNDKASVHKEITDIINSSQAVIMSKNFIGYDKRNYEHVYEVRINIRDKNILNTTINKLNSLHSISITYRK